MQQDIVIALVFLLAGLVKGVTGLGVPTVSLALLAAAVGLQPAMALLLVPSFVTNLWQALAGGALAAILRRLWPLLLAAALTTWLGVRLQALVDGRLLSGVLGLLLCAYAAFGLARPQLPEPGRHEPRLAPLVGALNGLSTGLTGSFVMPGVPYLQALGLPRDALVQAMGVLFTVSTVALALGLADRRLVSADLALRSAGALLPCLAGMLIGQALRRRLPEILFRRLFLGALLLPRRASRHRRPGLAIDSADRGRREDSALDSALGCCSAACMFNWTQERRRMRRFRPSERAGLPACWVRREFNDPARQERREAC
jgi:uncharacterized membrane protein YfcA